MCTIAKKDFGRAVGEGVYRERDLSSRPGSIPLRSLTLPDARVRQRDGTSAGRARSIVGARGKREVRGPPEVGSVLL